MNVTAPHFKWELNVNSIALLFTLIASVAGYGYLYAELVHGKTTASTEISKIWGEIAALKASNSRVENLEYRMTSVENLAREGIMANRDTAAALNSLATDMRVTKEILQRLEASAGRRTGIIPPL